MNYQTRTALIAESHALIDKLYDHGWLGRHMVDSTECRTLLKMTIQDDPEQAAACYRGIWASLGYAG